METYQDLEPHYNKKLKPMIRKDKLYGWIFHFNPFRNKWEAVHKDNYKELFSGGSNVIRNSSLELLKNEIVNKK